MLLNKLPGLLGKYSAIIIFGFINRADFFEEEESLLVAFEDP